MSEDRWREELDDLLSGSLDVDRVRGHCKKHELPGEKRGDLWKVFLGVSGKPDSLSGWDEKLNLANQSDIQSACWSECERLLVEWQESERQRIATEMEHVITYYCKARAVSFTSDCGWAELLVPFFSLGLSRHDAYNCFYALLSRYIPQQQSTIQLFRWLLLYHEPELCSFLDTKKLKVEKYLSKWTRGLFVSTCELNVVLTMWDIYFVESNPFLVFFLSLVILINAKETIMEGENSHDELIETISSFPCQLGADDVDDFCSLADYYITRTPQSLKLDFKFLLFGSTPQPTAGPLSDDIFTRFLCFPVSISELISSVNQQTDQVLRYLVVDCRPVEQYTCGHLVGAKNLDPALMLQSPAEFSSFLDNILALREICGEHICCFGSGRSKEDQYLNMVVARLLQHNIKYVSVARGGYSALYTASLEHVGVVIEGLDPKAHAQYGVSAASSMTATTSEDDMSGREATDGAGGTPAKKESLVFRLSSVLRDKSSAVKAKINKWMTEAEREERHVSSSDKASKSSLYRGVKPVFSIDDEDDLDGSGSSSGDEEKHEAINLETWKKRTDVIQTIPCNEISITGSMHPTHLLLTRTHMFVLHDISNRKGWATIRDRQLLTMIVKITSKKKYPDLITFKFGSVSNDGVTSLTGRRRFLIPKAQRVMKVVRDAIMNAVDEDI
ncbi:TBC1 domain family member 23-like [Corticium candelabrum]|uniref:TBC1 domain family member 23-like n=1 Tax=Corticium candelabrum TaxID=121492 RepID=UPI002E258A56|nr:TBC1 domain family member 23-like [Corticium candelabrum]